MTDDRANRSLRAFVPDYLEMGDGLAVLASHRATAIKRIADEHGVRFQDVRVEKKWLKPCDCELCDEVGPAVAHGFDSFWIYCEKESEGAIQWWVERV